MDSLHLDLSPAHAAFVDEQVALGGYANASDFIAKLIDARAKAQNQLEALLLEGLDGEALEWTPDLVDDIRRKAGLIE